MKIGIDVFISSNFWWILGAYQQFGEKGGLIDKVNVDVMWVVAKMSMSVRVRGVGGQKWIKSCPRGYWTAPKSFYMKKSIWLHLFINLIPT